MKKWLVGLMAAGLCAASAWANTVDVLTRETTGVSGSNYKDWTATGESGTAYAGNSAGGNDAIQLRSNNNNSGIVTTDSIGNAAKVTIVWNENTAADRVVDVYGKDTAYDSPADLYAKDKQGDKLGSFKNADGEATELTIDGDYAFIGLRSSNQALYLDKVEIEWAGGTPPAFSIKLDPAEDFTVVQGKSASITATVKGAQGDVTYSWSVDGTPIDLAGNVYTIDSAKVGGPYEVKCEADDGVSDPVSASVSYSVTEAPVVSGDVLTRETTGVTGTNYKDWTATGDSGAEYAGNSAGGNESIQLRTTNPSGIVITKSSGKDVASVTVEWNDATADKRSVEIYGSTEAYAGPADLYGDAKGTKLGTLAKGETALEVPEGYPYVGILPKGGALYLTSVAIDFAGASGPSVSLKTSAESVEVGEALTITATATGFSGDVEWSWEGGDGGSAEGAVYTVNTAAEGEFTIKATATYGDESAWKDITVAVTPALVAHSVTVTVTEGEGTAEADVAEAKKGETVNLTVTPGDGYKVGSITVNGTAISGTSFEMLDEDVTVAVTFVEKPVLSGDVLTRETTGVEGTSYADWTATGESGTKYSGNSAGGNDSIQLRTTNKNSGLVITESAGSDVASVTVEWNDATSDGRAIQIYGSADAYTSAADLYGDNKGTLLGTLAKGETTLEVPEGYAYIGIRSKDGALYLSSVAIAFAGAAKPQISFEGETSVIMAGGEAAFALQFSLANYDGDYTWAVKSGEGSIDGNGAYTWTATKAGEYSITVAAVSGEDTIATKDVKLTASDITPPPGDITLTCDPSSVTMEENEDVYVDVLLTGAVLDESYPFIYFVGYEETLCSEVNPETFNLAALGLSAGTHELTIAVGNTVDEPLVTTTLSVTVTSGGGSGGEEIQDLTVDSKGGTLSFKEPSGAYTVESTKDLVNGPWVAIQVTVENGQVIVPMEDGPRYYRVAQ
jgi:hypothetical protein